MVEGARLESVYTGNGIAGSNPALSAFARRSFAPPLKLRRHAVSVGGLCLFYAGASADAVRGATVPLSHHEPGICRHTQV